MFFVQILKDLSNDDGSQENNEDEIQNQEHVGDLLGTMRSSATCFPFDTDLHRRSAQGKEQPIGNDTRTDGHDQKWNENIRE